MALNEQLDPQKYLILCFSDGKLCFYSVFNDTKRLKITRIFLCYNANEGLPYLINSPNSNIDRSITDPNYKLKIPIIVIFLLLKIYDFLKKKKITPRFIEEIKAYYLNKNLLLLVKNSTSLKIFKIIQIIYFLPNLFKNSSLSKIRIDNNEFLVYRGLISLDKTNNFSLVFTRIKLDIPFAIQLPLDSFPQKSFSDREPSNLPIIPFQNAKRTCICKHRYSDAIQAIFIYNCPKSFALFEKNGEIFAHPVNLPSNKSQNNLNNNEFIQGFAKFTYPEPVNNPTAKGCLFLINEKTLVFCELAYADYDQLKIKEDYNFFDYRSPMPYLSIIFQDKVIDKFEILERNQKKFIILSVYKLGERNGANDNRKYELLLLDSE